MPSRATACGAFQTLVVCPVRVTPAGSYGYPAFLPDGAHVLYTWFGSDPQPGVYIGDVTAARTTTVETSHRRRICLERLCATGSRSRRILLALREGVLTARSFDPVTATVSGEPVVMAQDVPTVDPPAAFSASLTGALAFTTSTSADRSRLVWFDRSGKELGQLGPPPTAPASVFRPTASGSRSTPPSRTGGRAASGRRIPLVGWPRS